MLRLVPFELSKIYGKRSFFLAICALLTLHLFLLWYTSLPNDETPPLAAYRKIQSELSGKSEAEKGSYITALKQTMDGICFVRDILAMQGFQSEMGDVLAEQEMQSNPGVFERYYEMYQSGDYLIFTDSLERESAFINQIYEEWQKVSGYGDYLRSIRENKAVLSEISVFGGQENNTYSARNLKKSAADYAHLTDYNVRFTPEKGITSAMHNMWTDLFVLLGVMLFVAGMITEEKEKQLFFITRSTRHGVFASIMSKLAALLIHCILLTVLFYTVNLLFFGQSTGWFAADAGLQSLASYMESCLSVSIFEYFVISVLTKAFLLFGTGAVLTLFCILSRLAVLPFLAAFVLVGGSALMYYLIPAGGAFTVFKYINLVGLMKTENLYGGYLNFNLFGYPISRAGLSIILILLICLAGVTGSVWMFVRMRNFEAGRLRLSFYLPFQPYVNIFRHEGYKIFITNHALVILALFAVLLAYRSVDRTYKPSAGEQYYRDIMETLEGELTEEKESLVLSEQARYEEAFQKIEDIEEMVSLGELSQDAADALKAQADMTLAFYPAFCRVEEQYAYIREHGGRFVYETGYLYLFGMAEDVFSMDFLIVSIGLILITGGAMTMEYQSGALFLLGATRTGRRKILLHKILICGMAAAVLALIPVLCRVYRIASVYPMHESGASIRNIPSFKSFAISVPIGLFVLFFVLSQATAAVIVTLLATALSIWRKNQAQTIFFSLLLLAVPMILRLLGFEIAQWFSLYPLYAWTTL